ncbi:MAG: hypothetical protein ABI609_10765 [Acidobacteriota bacterium]
MTEPGAHGFYTARASTNQRRFYIWLIGAMLAYLGATAAVRFKSSVPAGLAWSLVVLAWLLAIQTIRSYLAFLRGADELLRKIEIEALGLGFGVGAFFSMLYPLLRELGAPDVGQLGSAVVMMFAAAIGSWLGRRRYCGVGSR